MYDDHGFLGLSSVVVCQHIFTAPGFAHYTPKSKYIEIPLSVGTLLLLRYYTLVVPVKIVPYGQCYFLLDYCAVDHGLKFPMIRGLNGACVTRTNCTWTLWETTWNFSKYKSCHDLKTHVTLPRSSTCVLIVEGTFTTMLHKFKHTKFSSGGVGLKFVPLPSHSQANRNTILQTVFVFLKYFTNKLILKIFLPKKKKKCFF